MSANENVTPTKQTVKVIYKNSGVKLCNVFSKVFMILAIVFVVFTILSFAEAIDDNHVEDFIAAFMCLSSAITCGALMALFKVLSSIAKTALYKRAVLEQSFEFVEVEIEKDEDAKR